MSSTSVWLTRAPGGPCRTSRSNARWPPLPLRQATSTRPSSRFRTQPCTPSRAADRTDEDSGSRRPATRPLMRYRRARFAAGRRMRVTWIHSEASRRLPACHEESAFPSRQTRFSPRQTDSVSIWRITSACRESRASPSCRRTRCRRSRMRHRLRRRDANRPRRHAGPRRARFLISLVLTRRSAVVAFSYPARPFTPTRPAAAPHRRDKENISQTAGLVAAASLLVDYHADGGGRVFPPASWRSRPHAPQPRQCLPRRDVPRVPHDSHARQPPRPEASRGGSSAVPDVASSSSPSSS